MPGSNPYRRPRNVLHDPDIIFRSQRRQQVVLLKHEPDRRLPKIRPLRVRHTRQVTSLDPHRAGGRRRQPAREHETGSTCRSRKPR